MVDSKNKPAAEWEGETKAGQSDGEPPPRTTPKARPVDDIISRLKEARAGLRPAEQRVADAVLSDVDYAVHASNADLAQRANVSEPTVTRFCRTIGCDGVRDFKLRLAQSLVVGNMYFKQPPRMPDGGALLPYWSSVFDNVREAIDQAERQIDPQQIRAAVEMLATARRVFVFGVGGGSTAIAQDTQYRLFRYGIAVTAYCDAHLMRMVSSTLGADDVVIAISATGRSPEVLESVALARQYHARVIALTTTDSPLAASANILLGLEIVEIADVLKPTASRYAHLAVIDLLATGVGYRLGRDAQETLRRIKYNLLNFRDGDILEPLGD